MSARGFSPFVGPNNNEPNMKLFIKGDNNDRISNKENHSSLEN